MNEIKFTIFILLVELKKNIEFYFKISIDLPHIRLIPI